MPSEEKMESIKVRDCVKVGVGVSIRICGEVKSSTLREEGDIWYDSSAHVLKYRDNVGVKTVTASA